MRVLRAFTLTFSVLCLRGGATRAQPPQRYQPKPPLSVSSVTVPLITMPFTMGPVPSLATIGQPAGVAPQIVFTAEKAGGSPRTIVSPARPAGTVVPADGATLQRGNTSPISLPALSSQTRRMIAPATSAHSTGLIGPSATVSAASSLIVTAQTGKMVSLIDISGGTASLAGATAPMIVAQLRSGSLDVNAAWDKGLISPEAAVGLLSAPGLLGYDATDEALRVRLADLVMERAPELLIASSKDSDEAKLTLADWNAARKDARAGVLYEELLSDDLSADELRSSAAFRILVLERAVQHYLSVNEYAKAADVLASARRFTKVPSYVGNSLVEAARFYRQAGQEEKAQALYGEVAGIGYGWATGIARIDGARQFLEMGKFREAIDLLDQPLSGLYADQIKIALLATRGQVYYWKGDFQMAEKYSLQAIDEAKNLELLPNEGFEWTIASANEIVNWSRIWSKNPVLVEPAEIVVEVTPVKGPAKPLTRKIRIRTHRRIALQSKNDDSGIKPYISGQNQDADYFSQQDILLTVTPSPAGKDGPPMLTLSSPQIKSAITIPIRYRTP